jgi:hypothetical protein
VGSSDVLSAGNAGQNAASIHLAPGGAMAFER